jgi:hypothetical protein
MPAVSLWATLGLQRDFCLGWVVGVIAIGADDSV